MNIESSKINLTEKKETHKVNTNVPTEASVKFTDELSNVVQAEETKLPNNDKKENKELNTNISLKIENEITSYENPNLETNIVNKILEEEFPGQNLKENIEIENNITDIKTPERDVLNIENFNNVTKIETNKDLEANANIKIEYNKNKKTQQKIKTNIFAKENIHIDKALDNLNSIVKELNQSDDNIIDPIKKEEKISDNKDMINNDFNIQENKDLLPQMNPNMNFSGDGQPFSSFMNNEENTKKETKTVLRSSAKELAEEAAILSTMAENIAIANKNQIVQPQEVVKTVNRQDGVKKVDTKTNTVVETVVKYDTIIMNETDVEVFANLVENKEVDIKNLTTQATEKSVQISKTLADMLAKAMEKNQPVRIDFDNNISVIIKISRDGKITADFLPSSQVAEAYLKENLPLLRQRFNDNNIEYDSLNQRERRESGKENNRRKGRNNE